MNWYAHHMYRKERKLSLQDTNRRVFPFEWGIDWLGNGAPAEDPLSYLKLHAEQALADSDSFFNPGPLTEYTLEEDLLTFPSAVTTRHLENNIARCRIFPARNTSRAVIVIPQWNAGVESHVALCRALQRFGITAVRVTLPYHEERAPGGMKRADFMVSPNIGRTLQATRQAVLEVLQLSGWLRQRHQRVGVVGTSIGSCVGFLSFVHDPAFCTGVFNHVSSFFADVVWDGLATRFVRWGLEEHISLEDLRCCWSPISPWYFIPRLRNSPRPHLLISARYDLTFLPVLSRKVFEQYRAHGIAYDYAELPCGHYTTELFPFKYIDGWHICRYLLRHL
ncbi:MAG: hypothetical protein HY645_09180 [Acidobacteria bacterium]|nr:hypothetical protein [Acidobacteriota bacterium]